VSENLATIEQLRRERALLAASHKDLQRQYAEASDVSRLRPVTPGRGADGREMQTVAHLRETQAVGQTSHDDRRAELDAQLAELGALRDAKAGTEGAVAALEADLRRVRREAEAFGRDLARLRAEREDGVRREQDARAEADEAAARVVRYKDEVARVRRELEAHVCPRCIALFHVHVP
jgi:chromosome segregation ATPase